MVSPVTSSPKPSAALVSQSPQSAPASPQFGKAGQRKAKSADQLTLQKTQGTKPTRFGNTEEKSSVFTSIWHGVKKAIHVTALIGTGVSGLGLGLLAVPQLLLGIVFHPLLVTGLLTLSPVLIPGLIALATGGKKK